MAFQRPGTQQKSAFGISFDVDRDTSSTLPPLHSTNERLTIEEHRRKLPIYKHKTDILYLVQHTATTIIVGETSSGKSTQLPQYLLEAGWTRSGKLIACTQPRRVATIAVAARTAEEMGCRLGEDVGYAIRFEDVSTPGKTKIKYCTDGVLLREMMNDPLLTKYSVIIVDEAHERSLESDVLLGLLKKVQKRRNDLRVVVSSATLQAEAMAQFFDRPIQQPVSSSRLRKSSLLDNNNDNNDNGDGDNNTIDNTTRGIDTNTNTNNTNNTSNSNSLDILQSTAILSVQGRVHAVQIHYIQHPTSNYITTIVDTVMKIHKENLPGDILVFVPGQDDCERIVRLLVEESKHLHGGSNRNNSRGGGGNNSRRDGSNTNIHNTNTTTSQYYNTTEYMKLYPCALYAGLPSTAQLSAIQSPPRNTRKVVIATNIAETSLTVEGIVYVIDSMFSKQRCYNPLVGLESLVVAPISKANAAQRAGRAGRIRPGHVFRLCTEDDYENRLGDVDVPEMQKSDLSATLLQLKVLGIDNMMTFHWLSPPPAESMIRGLETLHALHALDDDARLSRPLGEQMAELPTGNPFLSKMLLESTKTGCSIEIATVVAMLSVQSIWAYSSDRKAVEKAKLKFAAVEGDLLTYLNVWRAWEESKKSKKWSYTNYINHRSMLRAADIRDQLLAHLKRMKLPLKSAFAGVSSMGSDLNAAVTTVCKTMTAGLFLNAVKITTSQHELMLHKKERTVGTLIDEDVNIGGSTGGGVYTLIRSAAMPYNNTNNNNNNSTMTTIVHDIKLKIHHTSVLYRKSAPVWMCFYTAQQNDSGYYDMQDVLVIDPGWLTEIAPHYFVQMPASTTGTATAMMMR